MVKDFQDFVIVDRQYKQHPEQRSYDLEPMLQYIDERQPVGMQLGAARIAEALAKLGGEGVDRPEAKA